MADAPSHAKSQPLSTAGEATDMGDNDSKNPVELDADLEREIREGRKFTLAEAIGRLAGPGMMKGISPATRKQQAEAVLESFLERHLNSPAGALSVVLLRQVKESDRLLNNLDAPLVVLAECIRHILASDYLLQELVQQADVEWGRTYDERPYFEKAGCPPHQDDPYTTESVHRALSHLLEDLAASQDFAAKRE
jgi:hypothetical protein